MWKVAKFFILAVVAIALLVFAFANRQIVNVSFDPFVSGDAPAFAIAAPLFLVLLLTLIIGVIVGGAAVWLSQRRFRRAPRQSRAEAARLRVQAAGAPVVR
jgi:uncharacterized integral membrane protein